MKSFITGKMEDNIKADLKNYSLRLPTGFKWLMIRSKIDSSVNSVMDFSGSYYSK
jgi:hypothetical protein